MYKKLPGDLRCLGQGMERALRKRAWICQHRPHIYKGR